MKAAGGFAFLTLALLPAPAAAQFPGTDLTQLSEGGGRNPAISQDKRFGRLVAFESGGNVFAVRRAEPYGENGTPWRAGDRVLVSSGLGGAPANGPPACRRLTAPRASRRTASRSCPPPPTSCAATPTARPTRSSATSAPA